MMHWDTAYAAVGGHQVCHYVQCCSWTPPWMTEGSVLVMCSVWQTLCRVDRCRLFVEGDV
jgi:hypothetical protein